MVEASKAFNESRPRGLHRPRHLMSLALPDPGLKQAKLYVSMICVPSAASQLVTSPTRHTVNASHSQLITVKSLHRQLVAIGKMRICEY